MKAYLLKIYYKILSLKDKLTIIYNRAIISKFKKPVVIDTDKTIETVGSRGLSVSRYGDGEFGLINGRNLIFQPYSKEIENRLREVLKSNMENHIVCIPDVFSSIDKFKEKPKKYWEKYLDLNRGSIYKIIDKNKVYYDALMTRLYVDYKDKNLSKNRFNKIKELWNNREVIIVEGEQSRLGIGNDLFKNAKSIERIIGPATDSFSKYDQILNSVTKESKSKLILIALGPTATILSFDLCKLGYQAIDIGHIDIEYEWFLRNADKKEKIENKFMAEIKGYENITECFDEEYLKQIIKRIN